MKPPVCHCGGVSRPHETGSSGCYRFVVDKKYDPQPFGKDPDTGFDMWVVEGALITDYTLRHQRGYHQHECGQWTRHHGSTNSIFNEDEQ